MNNTNKTKKVGFPETTTSLGSSTTTLNGSTYISGTRRLSKTRCKCGGRRFVCDGMVFLTYPAQYPVECEFCGAKNTVREDELITLVDTMPGPVSQWDSLTTPSAEECKHTFEIKLLNGRYVTYCTKCGKIGDNASVGIDLSDKTTINNIDAIPCIDPLRFTCAVGEKTVNQATINDDEIKKVKAYAGSTITTK